VADEIVGILRDSGPELCFFALHGSWSLEYTTVRQARNMALFCVLPVVAFAAVKVLSFARGSARRVFGPVSVNAFVWCSVVSLEALITLITLIVCWACWAIGVLRAIIRLALFPGAALPTRIAGIGSWALALIAPAVSPVRFKRAATEVLSAALITPKIASAIISVLVATSELPTVLA
jgi:hypothetical protein